MSEHGGTGPAAGETPPLDEHDYVGEPTDWVAFPTTGQYVGLAIVIVAMLLWGVSYGIQGPHDPAPAPRPMREMCAANEAAARQGAPSLPSRAAEVQRTLHERNETEPLYMPPTCAPGWQTAQFRPPH